LTIETKYYGDGDGDEVFPEDCPLAITNSRIESLEFEHFEVETRDDPLEAGQLLARIAARECATHFESRLLALELRFGLKETTQVMLHFRIEVLDKKVFGKSPSQPPLGRVAALEAFKSPLSGYQGSAALRGKGQGTMVSGSPSGDNVFRQSSPAAKADEIYLHFLLFPVRRGARGYGWRTSRRRRSAQ
jgi:hypothetical protein